MNNAVLSLIIMGICVVLFVTEMLPTSITAMLGCVLMVLFDVCSLSDVLNGFTSDTILLLFSISIVSEAMFVSGAAAMIGKAVVKFSGNDERRLILISTTFSAVLSAFLTNTAVIALMIAVCNGVVAVDKNMKMKNIALPVAIGTIFGGGITLVGCSGQLTATGILNELTGQSIEMFTMSGECIIMSIIAILYVTFIGYPMGKKIWGNRDENNSKMDMNMDLNANIDKKKAYTVIGIFALVIVLFFTGLTEPGIAATIGAILCVATKVITHKQAYSGVDWNVTIWLSCCLGLARGLNVSGGSQLIADFFLNMFSNVSSPFLFFAAMVLISMVLSQFIANLTTIVIMLPPAILTATAMGLNPLTFAIGITCGAGFTFATPLANGFVGMTMSAGYKFTDYLKYGWLLSLIAYIAIIVLVPLFHPL